MRKLSELAKPVFAPGKQMQPDPLAFGKEHGSVKRKPGQ